MPELIQRTSEQTFILPKAMPTGLTGARIAMIGVLVLAIFWALYVRQASQTTLTGQRVREIQLDIERIKRENMQLEIDIAALTAPVRIAERARALGLRPTLPSQVQYIVIKDFPTTNPPPLMAWSPLTTTARTTSWIDALRVNLGLLPRPPNPAGP